MNCQHFTVGVQIWNFDAQLLKTNFVTSTAETAAATNETKLDAARDLHDLGNWNCMECGSTASPWLCLACGLIHCGRYVNQHALRHFDANKDHFLCMDCYNYSIYCYACEEFVSNDELDSKLARVRTSLQYLNALRISDHSYFTPVAAAKVLPVKKSTRFKRRSARSISSTTVAENDIKKARKKRRIDDSKEDKYKSKSTKDESVSAKQRGLRNLGNTCFMNAVLQSLNNIDEFCQYFVKLPQLNVKKGSKTPHYMTRNSQVSEDDVFLSEELRKTLLALSQSGNSAISPDSLFSVVWKFVPRFRGYQQQDAHEFLRCILDRLHCELLRLAPATLDGNENSVEVVHDRHCASTKKSVITMIFEGTLESEVKCLLCQNLSKKYDPFLDISLDIPDQVLTKKDSGNITVQVCLESFFAEEHLSETELYKCVNCRRKQPSSKQFYVRRLPNVLCLHLKRFRWNTYYRKKIDCFVEFPLRNLNMEPYLFKNGPTTRNISNSSTLYDLAAIVVHHGSGTGSGHYTSYVQRDGSWFHFNDTAVRCCAEEAVLKQKAYILFYVRQNSTVDLTTER